MSASRLQLVDALRAFALAGILQVNIQSYAWGAGDPLGYFAEPPGLRDAAVYLLIGTFVSSKFLSIFAFLFGFGFVLFWRSLRRQQRDAARIYRRRLAFLLTLGLLHGALLYYGDILTAYAAVGILLLLYASARPAELAASTRRWWIAFAVVTVAATVVFEFARLAVPPETDPAQLPAAALEALTVYTQGSYLQQLGLRSVDFFSVLGAIALLAVPQLMALFLLGALAARLGWLARPQRHVLLWRRALHVGLAALPFAAAGAWVNFTAMRDSPGDPTFIGYALQNLGALTACLYVAAFVTLQTRPAMRRLIAWLAPAGRMPLTNYIAQSAAMGLLLSGWGLGLGDDLNRLQLALLALTIVAVQLVTSRAWIGRFGQGPLEALWRRVSYGAAYAPSGLR